MSTTVEFIEYVYDQIDIIFNKRYRKMFGEYMIYINDKPVLLVCDNTVYVKKLDCVKHLLSEQNCGFPYNGAKEHFIIDPEDRDNLNKIIIELEKITPIPVKKKRKR